MAMTSAERQARYRRNTRERQENYTARLNTEILYRAKNGPQTAVAASWAFSA